MKPLILKPIYKEKPWGNEKLLQQFKGVEKNNKIGESWEIILDENSISNFKNLTINMRDIFLNKKLCEKVFGNKYTNYKRFPILIKTLFINGKISLQVHPDNKCAKKYENDYGKNETWYVLYADNNTYANIGLKNILSKKKLQGLIDKNMIINYLNNKKIKTGDIINIPAGTIHSVSGKAVLYEIQQNSNTTYRICDSNKRDLNIEKAVNAFKNNYIKVRHKENGTLIKTKYFKLKKIKIINKKQFKTYGKFAVITVINGVGNIISDQNIKIQKGMTILIPACLSSYIISGNLELLITK